jgi:hypothetical protein
MPVGRPPLYSTPEELQAKIDEYFAGGYRKTKHYLENGQAIDIPDITISDLVIFLGFCDRHSFYDYEKRPSFSHTIKRARSFIEREYETLLKRNNCTGAIFALKNFGWIDKQEIDSNVSFKQMGSILVEDGKPKEYNIGDKGTAKDPGSARETPGDPGAAG